MSDYFGAMGTALLSKLSSGTALITALGGTAIFAEQAPDSYSLPYVVFSHSGGGMDTTAKGARRSNVWFVRAYSTDRAQANHLDGLCADLLGTALTVTGWNNYWWAREEDMELRETPPNGAPVYMAGGMYRIVLGE